MFDRPDVIGSVSMAGVIRVGTPCPGCGRRPIRLDTVDGKLIEIEDPCRCPTWRRLNGVCRWCNDPVTGKPKVAIYCDRHRKMALKRSQRTYYQKTGVERSRRYRERNRELLRIKARLLYQLDPEERERRNAYKREWRRHNPEKVRAQKRRYALRRANRNSEYQRRYKQEVKAGIRKPERARRNERGERLCLNPGCEIVVRGRAKKCERCKRAGAQAMRGAA